MTGIVGFTREAAGSAEPTHVLRRMQAMLTHYEHNKQDTLWHDSAVWITRVYNVVGQPDPQPYSRGGSVFVWMDGYLNNRDEVARQHDAGDIASDLQLLATLYEQTGGFAFLRSIDGFYAAVVYDTARQQLHLISDRAGLRLMYWTRHNGGLWWSSELKAALELPGFEIRIDRTSAANMTTAGNIFDNRSWFEGVQLVPAATVLTWDVAARTLSQQRYWWWNEIELRNETVDAQEAAEELGRLFLQAVEQRTPEPRANVELSGGLDSRAITAAIPADRDIHTYTSGQKDCEDIRIAAMVSKLRGATHHIYEVTPTNWLSADTLRDLWRQDGESGVLQLVGSRAHGHYLAEAPIRLNGWGGDTIVRGVMLTSGQHISPLTAEEARRRMRAPDLEFDMAEYAGLDRIEHFYTLNRVRRYVGGTVRSAMTHGEIRAPFLDNRIAEFLFTLPDSLRYQGYLYRLMLLRFFPVYYKTIPYQRTGTMIDFPTPWERIQRLPQKARRVAFMYARRFGWIQYKHNNPRYAPHDAPRWIRMEPNRSLFERVLLNPDAIYPDYISREEVVTLWQRHLRGEDMSKRLCWCLSAEIWLQQVLTGAYRPDGPASDQSPPATP